MGALALVVVEFFGPPRPLIVPEAQPFFNGLAAHPSPCLGELQQPLSGCDALLELPQATWIPPGMYHQVISLHPMVGGYISRKYPYSFSSETPGVAQLVSPDPAAFGPDIVTPAIRDVALQAMDYYGVRYVVAHSAGRLSRGRRPRRTLDLLFGPAGETRDGLTIYTTPRAPQDRAFLYLGDGWHDPEADPAAGLRWRWTEQRATIAGPVVPDAAAGA